MRYYLGPWDQSLLEKDDPDEPDEYYWHAPAGTVGLVDLRSIPGVTQSDYGFFCVPDHLSLASEYELLGQGHLSEINTDGTMLSTWSTLLGITETIESATLLDLLWDTLGPHADPTGQDRAKPNMPDRFGNLNLHLGGHSLVKSMRFRDIPGIQRERILAVEKMDLERIRQDSRDGRLVNPRTRQVDTEMHQRVMQALVEKYRLDWEELRPRSWPHRETPLRHDTVITDDFNREDGPAGESAEGWSWSGGSISSNQLHLNTQTVRAEIDLSGADLFSEADVTYGNANQTLVRFSDSAETWYGCRRLSSSTVQILRRINGSQTILGDESFSSSAPYRLRTEVDGSTITGFIDAVQVMSLTDTSITGYLRTGIRASNQNQTFNDFEAGDLAAEPGPGVAPWFFQTKILSRGRFGCRS